MEDAVVKFTDFKLQLEEDRVTKAKRCRKDELTRIMRSKIDLGELSLVSFGDVSGEGVPRVRGTNTPSRTDMF